MTDLVYLFFHPSYAFFLPSAKLSQAKDIAQYWIVARCAGAEAAAAAFGVAAKRY